MKLCSNCKELKDETAFYKNKNVKSGLRSWCKACSTRDTAGWRERNRDRYNKRQKEYSKAWRKDNPGCIRKHDLRARFNLSEEEYDKLKKAQNNLCAICKKEESFACALSVDHDHSCCKGVTSCGECIRGLLCRKCNLALGLLGEDLDCVKRAANYLERYASIKSEDTGLDAGTRASVPGCST